MERLHHYFIVLAVCLFMSSAFAQKEKTIVGNIEKIILLPEKITINGKLDTGAHRSSLTAQDIQYIEIDGKKWVEFVYDDGKHQATLRKPFVKMTKIKNRHAEQKSQGKSSLEERPVVKLDICIAGKSFPVEASLANRSNFNYPMLIGRTAMVSNNLVIDPSLSHTMRCRDGTLATSEEEISNT